MIGNIIITVILLGLAYYFIIEARGKMRDLVKKLNQRGRFEELLLICQNKRPHVSWKDI